MYSRAHAERAPQREAGATPVGGLKPTLRATRYSLVHLTPEREARRKRTPQGKVMRRAPGLSQKDFAARFQIPLGTLLDWEQGRKDPDAAARAYLVVIGRKPAAVTEALHSAGL